MERECEKKRIEEQKRDRERDIKSEKTVMKSGKSQCQHQLNPKRKSGLRRVIVIPEHVNNK